ncbi:MAG TPA: hypothetical protein DDZ51_01830 [Planctomycetaceae bacterium]|nr:hypothetical protein [Planctomycetaceae bacterium]
MGVRLTHSQRIFAESVLYGEGLELASRNPDERSLYEERLKMNRDERVRNFRAQKKAESLFARKWRFLRH